MIPFQREETLIQTIPGISKTNASAIIAEIGADMSQFPTDAHLASWAGMFPENNESAGVKKRALIALGHRILLDIYRVLTIGEPFVDEGSIAVHQRNLLARQKSAIRFLEQSGYTIAKASA
jgi:hypothetical protein